MAGLLKAPYERYSPALLGLAGWGSILACAAASAILTLLAWRRDRLAFEPYPAYPPRPGPAAAGRPEGGAR
ncbi:MAG: hypothetical protein LBD70_07875 [Bifidobacteriaceae bacterium]|nr:hypothetical protein [Bifidobacteriaceae bacterium]